MAASATSTLITVAPTGAAAETAAVPALPVTLNELVVTAKLVERAADLARHAQRPPMGSADARAYLGIPDRPA